MSHTKHAILILFDHTNPDIFYRMCDEGLTPNISKYILGEKGAEGHYNNASICRHMITGFPSTSANTHTSILTGEYAGKNNIIHTRYWTCPKKTPILVDTEDLTPKTIKNLNQKFIAPECKTIFEYVPYSASYHGVNRGATMKGMEVNTIFRHLPTAIPMIPYLNEDLLLYPEIWSRMLRMFAWDLLRSIQRTKRMPQITFFIYLYSDANAHRFGFNSPQYKEAFRILDNLIGLLVEGDPKEKIPGLKELGFFDSTVWAICTDHAGRRVRRNQWIMINQISEIETGLTLIEGWDAVKLGRLKAFHGKFNTIDAMTSVTGEIMHFWFGLGSGSTINDASVPFYGENYYRNYVPKGFPTSRWIPKSKLAEISPLYVPPLSSRGYRDDAPAQGSEPIDLIRYYTNLDGIQFVVIPEEDPAQFNAISSPDRIREPIPREYQLKIFSRKGVAVASRILRAGVRAYSYRVLEGEDPLGYTPTLTSLQYNTFYDQKMWLNATGSLELPDAIHRLYGCFDCRYAPNFMITSDINAFFLNPVHKLRQSIVKTQSHDGLFSAESVVPFTIAGPGIKKEHEIPIARTVDILPTLLDAIDVKYDSQILDGETIENLLDK